MLMNGLILAAFAIVTTLLIGLTFTGTESTIVSQEQKKLQGILSAIVPTEKHDNDMRLNCTRVSSVEYLGDEAAQTVYRAYKADEATSLAIETIAPDGYSGKIHLVVGVDTGATVTGVRVLKHKETPGLGDKIDIRVSDWITSFDGKTLNEDNAHQWAVRKDGGQFDQFTGATITPRAVVNSVKKAVEYAKLNQNALFTAANQCDITDKEQQGDTADE